MLGNVPAPRDPPPPPPRASSQPSHPTSNASGLPLPPPSRQPPGVAYGGSWAQFLAWADGEGLQALPAPPKSLREARPSSSRSFLECRTRHSGLADDRHQRAGAQLSMIRHRNGDRAVGIRLLHRDVAAAPPDFDETVGSEDAADLADRTARAV